MITTQKVIHSLFVMVVLIISSISCFRKVPYNNGFGSFFQPMAHWYENEGVGYVFFEVKESSRRLDEAFFEMSYQWENATGEVETIDFFPLDFNNAVHQHRLLSCAADMICGSYSWRLDGPLVLVEVRMRYSDSSDLSIGATALATNHFRQENLQEDSENLAVSDQYSFIPYGVFDLENQHFQARIENNFGSPTHQEVLSHGMVRNFRFSNLHFRNEDWDSVRKKIDLNGFVFPMDGCEDEQSDLDESFVVNATEAWFQSELDNVKNEIGSCFHADLLDKDENILSASNGYGLKNPEIYSVDNLTLRTPLRQAKQIKIIVKVCDDDEFANELQSKEFLNYQKFILSAAKDEKEVCFSVSNPQGFAQSFASQLSESLIDAKTNSDNFSDYIFIVIFHENLSEEFYHFHSSIAEAITKIANDEADNISPRLVGALVYGSNEAYRPSQAQRKFILWCPQEQPDSFIDARFPLANPNCTTTAPQNFNVLGINFVTPLGPFPSLNIYEDYLKKYGDTGIAKSPELSIATVPITNSTYQEKDGQVTYFESNRLNIAEGEAVKVCHDRPGSEILEDLRFRPSSLGSLDNGLTVDQVEGLWLSGATADSYSIGLAWEFPFWGGISYKSAVISGSIVSVIPFQKSLRTYETLGDSKWQSQSWNIGEFLQYCRRYCDHPYFDAGGIYQLRNQWRQNLSFTCEDAVAPVWKQKGA